MNRGPKIKVVEPSEILVDRDGTIRDEPIRANPWLRFLARMFDYSWFFCALWGARKAFGLPVKTDTFIPIEYFVWIPFETLFLCTFGKTPGKWLTGTDLRHGRKLRLDFSTALQRSFKVWIRGLGLGIVVINVLCMAAAYQRLKLFRVTSWDRDDHIGITHHPVSPLRLYFATAVALFGLSFYFFFT